MSQEIEKQIETIGKLKMKLKVIETITEYLRQTKTLDELRLVEKIIASVNEIK